jgi:hypothetical protein
VAGGFALALLVSADAGAGAVLVADRPEASLPAHVDLTGAQYANDVDGFSARLTVRDLVPRTATVGFTLRFPRTGQLYRVTATRTRAGTVTSLVTRDRGDGRTRRTCDRFPVTWDDTQDRIDVHVPWTCLGDLRAPLKAQSHLGAGRDDQPDDYVKTVRVAYT